MARFSTPLPYRSKEVNKRHFIKATQKDKKLLNLKRNELNLLIYRLLIKFGDLNKRQIRELVEMFNISEKYADRYIVSNRVSAAITDLEFKYGLITFDSKNLVWKILGDWRDILNLLNEKSYIPLPFIDPKEFKPIERGKGQEFVYALYVPEDKINSIIKLKNFYAVKVGRTKDIKRRLRDLSVSGPNILGIDLCIRTDNSRQLEKLFHKKLKANFAQLPVPHRKEWFYTTKFELLKIYNELISEKTYF